MINKKIKRIGLGVITTLSFVISSSLFAVNGAFDFGYSEITRGMGGSGSALPQDAVIAAINPAGMVWVGHQADLGAVAYFPYMYYRADFVSSTCTFCTLLAPGKVNSNIDLFILPDFGINWMLDPNSSLGISLYSLGGFGSAYTDTVNATTPLGTSSYGPFGGGVLRTDLKQAITSFTYARKVTPVLSFGISLLVGLQTLDIQGASGFSVASLDPNNLSNKGHAYSFGAGGRVGFLVGPPQARFSISYQPEVPMTKLKQYAGILPDHGSFNLPPNGIIGVALKPRPNLAVTFDVQKIWFDTIKLYGNNGDFLLNPITSIVAACASGDQRCFGGSQGVGFGWGNSLSYKVGFQWESEPGLWWRMGYNHALSVIQRRNIAVNIVVPGGAIEDLLTAGVTKSMGKNNRVNLVLVWVPSQNIHGPNLLSQPLGGPTTTQNVTIHARGFGLGASWTWLL